MATLRDITRNSNIQAIWDVVRRFTRGRWTQSTIPTMPEIIAMLSLTELTPVTIPAGSASPYLIGTLDKSVKHAVLVYPQDKASWAAIQKPTVQPDLVYDDETGNLYLTFDTMLANTTLIINDMLAADSAETIASLVSVPLQIQWHDTSIPYVIGDIVLIKRGQETALAIANESTQGAFDESKWTVMLSEEDFTEKYKELDYRKSDKYFRTVQINRDITQTLPATAASIISIGINPTTTPSQSFVAALENHTIEYSVEQATLSVDSKALYVNGVAQAAFTVDGVAWDGIAILTFGPGARLPLQITGTIPEGLLTVIGIEQVETVQSNFLALVAEIARAQAAETQIQSNLNAENARAVAKENQLQTDLNAEVQRATSAESTIQGNLDAEVSRATGVEQNLQSQITAEVNRSTAKDTEHDSEIALEIQRAEAAEQTLTTNLATEVTQRKSKDVLSLTWDASSNSIIVTRTDNSTTSLALPLADESKNGIMSKQTYLQVQKNTQDIATLQGKGTRRLTSIAITPEPSPKPDAAWQASLNAAWLQASGNIPPVENDTLISSNANTLWSAATYVASSSVWVYRGKDTLNIASPTELGIVLSTEPTTNKMEDGGSVFVEQGDGSMWVNGWDDATSRITNLESFMNRTSGFATTAQGAKADSAIQSVVADTATTNGQIKLLVNKGGTQVVVDAVVAGLKSAAYTESSAYATSSQGTRADNAVRSVASGAAPTNGQIRLVVNTGGTTSNVDVAVTGLGSAAYTNSSAYATAQQGQNADAALAGVQGASADAAAAQAAAQAAQTSADSAATAASAAQDSADAAEQVAQQALAAATAAVQSVTAGTAAVNGQIRLVVTDGNGTRNVDATVLGLKSAAYTESSAYATSAQGTLADNAVRSITAGTAADNGKIRLVVNTGGTTANVDVTVTGLGSAAYTASSSYATAAQGTLATNAVRSVSAAASTTDGRIVLTVNQGGTSSTTNIDIPGWSKKADDFQLNLSTSGGTPQADKFMTVDYNSADSNNGVLIKLAMVSGHGNGSSYRFLQDVILSVNYLGEVSGEVFKYYGQDATYDSATRKFGDIFWTVDTTNKVVVFYTLLGQYATLKMTPYKRLNSSSGGIITQHTGSAVQYSSGTKVWANGNATTYARLNEVVDLTTDQTVGGAKTFSGGVTFSAAAFNYTGIENATADADRNIWFSDSSIRGKPTYNDNFKYNPAQRKLTLGGGSITYDASTDTFTV